MMHTEISLFHGKKQMLFFRPAYAESSSRTRVQSFTPRRDSRGFRLGAAWAAHTHQRPCVPNVLFQILMAPAVRYNEKLSKGAFAIHFSSRPYPLLRTTAVSSFAVKETTFICGCKEKNFTSTNISKLPLRQQLALGTGLARTRKAWPTRRTCTGGRSG